MEVPIAGETAQWLENRQEGPVHAEEVWQVNASNHTKAKELPGGGSFVVN